MVQRGGRKKSWGPGRFIPGVFVRPSVLGYKRLALDRASMPTDGTSLSVWDEIPRRLIRKDNADIFHTGVSSTNSYPRFKITQERCVGRCKNPFPSPHRLHYFLECA